MIGLRVPSWTQPASPAPSDWGTWWAGWRHPATIDVATGWWKVMGLVPLSLFLACAFVVSNLVVADAFATRQENDHAGRRPGWRPDPGGGGAPRSPPSLARPTHRRSDVFPPAGGGRRIGAPEGRHPSVCELRWLRQRHVTARREDDADPNVKWSPRKT